MLQSITPLCSLFHSIVVAYVVFGKRSTNSKELGHGYVRFWILDPELSAADTFKEVIPMLYDLILEQFKLNSTAVSEILITLMLTSS